MLAKSVALVGAGQWGQKILAALTRCPNVEVRYVIDRNPTNRREIENLAPSAKVLKSLAEMSSLAPPDLAVVATQASGHSENLHLLLQLKIPTLVEKPLALTHADAVAIASQFEDAGLGLAVDHIYLHSPTFKAFARAFRAQFLKRAFSYSSERLDFGAFPKDVDVLGNLLYHDFYILDDLIGLDQLFIRGFLKKGTEVARVLLEGPSGSIFSLSASNLYPQKVRQISVSDQSGALLWDDLKVGQEVRLSRYAIGEAHACKPKMASPQILPAEGADSALDSLILNWSRNLKLGDSVAQSLRVKAFIERVRGSAT